MQYLKNEFINLMLENDVIQFGSFITKSGFLTPYFINMGNFNTGKQLNFLGNFLAKKIQKLNKIKFDSIFGPAYKGISLSVCCCAALFNNFKIDVPFFFDRKEEKDHGEGGNFIGHKPCENEKILIIEDVLTAGTELKKIVPKIKAQFKVEVNDVLIIVDRCEKIKNSNETASQHLKKQLNLNIHALINIFDIKNFIEQNKNNKFKNYVETLNIYLNKNCIDSNKNYINSNN